MHKNMAWAIMAYIVAGMFAGAMLAVHFFDVSYLISISLGLTSLPPAFVGFRYHKRVEREFNVTKLVKK